MASTSPTTGTTAISASAGSRGPGDYNARVLLQIDGHRLNDNVFGSALIGTEFPLDVRSDRTHRDHPRTELGALWHERVLRGHQRHHAATRSTEQRTRSIGDARAASTRCEGRVSYGRHFATSPNCRGSGTGCPQRGARAALLSRSSTIPTTNNGIAEHADSDQFTQLFARRLSGQPDAAGAVWHAGQAHAHGILRNGLRRSANRARSKRSGFLDLQYTRKLRAHGSWPRALSYDRYGYDGDYVYESEDESRRVTSRSTRTSPGATGGGRSSRPAGASHESSRVALGAEYRNNFRQDQYNYDLETVRAVPRRSAGFPELGALRAGRDHPPPEASAEPGRPPRSLRHASAERPTRGWR